MNFLQLPDNDPFRVAYITGLMENGIVFKQEINTLKMILAL